jgi:hypothetical protein
VSLDEIALGTRREGGERGRISAETNLHAGDSQPWMKLRGKAGEKKGRKSGFE